ncbi:MAG: cyclopropane-fatty-acyl-phospholipid synthase family protein [Pirellulaceae bacterium]|nr:cyclopropane-fatty-acyl-phospholipid synthase family protein [Pirellulaceae bacterium]
MNLAEGTALVDALDSPPVGDLAYKVQRPKSVRSGVKFRSGSGQVTSQDSEQLSDRQTLGGSEASEHETFGALRWRDRQFRNLLFRQLNRIKAGQFSVQDADGTFEFGATDSLIPPVRVEIHNPSAYRRLVLGGDLGFADSLIAGDFSADNLVALMRILVDNTRTGDRRIGKPSFVRQLWGRVGHWLRRNHRANSRRNIEAHYDLSNEFFAKWLDPTLSYSSGVFPELSKSIGPSGEEWRSEASMESASLLKLDRLCQKLDLNSSDHLLEVGCGWGGLAVYAAKKYGCRITGVTLSPAQLEVAQQRVEAAGLADLVTLRLQDYRDIQGQFDKLVSVEMIEAVGHQFQDEYFRQCCRLLKSDGRMVLQGITIVDHRYQDYLKQVDFIREYVFPGGCLISTSGVLKSVAQETDFRVIHIEDIGFHYAETLRRWRTEFHRHWDDIADMGFDARFFRLWDYYLAYCEAGFAEGHVGTIQVVLDRPKKLVPLSLGVAPGTR